jgi:hypothetical protein
MLADEILAAVNSPVDQVYYGAISMLGDAISRAKRFDLSPGVIVTAYTVAGSSLRAQIRALPLCRLPFEFVWMEWPGSDSSYASFQEKTDTALAPPPQRVGVLIHTDDSRQVGSMTFAWSHRQHGLNACPIGCFFDWRENGEEVGDVSRDLFRATGGSEEDLKRIIIEQNKGMPQIKATSDAQQLEDRSRFGFHVSPAFERWARATILQHGSLPGPGTPVWRQWMGDIKGEPGKVRSILMLLNSRNLTEQQDVPAPERLNKQRVKSGKLPLAEHTIVRIKLSHALQQRAGLAGQREASRLHAVRGHFKTRNGKLYWWSDHVRGDVSRGLADSSYKVDSELPPSAS